MTVFCSTSTASAQLISTCKALFTKAVSVGLENCPHLSCKHAGHALVTPVTSRIAPSANLYTSGKGGIVILTPRILP